jgi:hypothetical protein
VLTRSAAAALVAGLLLSGCTSGEEPRDVARTDGPPSPSSGPDRTQATDEGAPQAALDFGGSFGSTLPGCSPRRSYLAAYHSFEVTREVSLGDPVVQGGGRLVGEVLLLPAPGGPENQGLSTIAARPSLRLGRTSHGWEQRVPMAGQVVQPGEHALFVQVEARPGRAVRGVFFDWSDRGTTGSDLLELELRYPGRCRG